MFVQFEPVERDTCKINVIGHEANNVEENTSFRSFSTSETLTRVSNEAFNSNYGLWLMVEFQLLLYHLFCNARETEKGRVTNNNCVYHESVTVNVHFGGDEKRVQMLHGYAISRVFHSDCIREAFHIYLRGSIHCH